MIIRRWQLMTLLLVGSFVSVFPAHAGGFAPFLFFPLPTTTGFPPSDSLETLPGGYPTGWTPWGVDSGFGGTQSATAFDGTYSVKCGPLTGLNVAKNVNVTGYSTLKIRYQTAGDTCTAVSNGSCAVTLLVNGIAVASYSSTSGTGPASWVTLSGTFADTGVQRVEFICRKILVDLIELQ
jgi:hypothetical protein